MKVNILNLVLNDLASFCLLPNKTTKAQWLKKPPQKLKHLLFLMIIWVGQIVPGLVSLGLTHLLCLTGKVIVLESQGGFPHCLTFGPCCPEVVLVLVNTFPSPPLG